MVLYKTTRNLNQSGRVRKRVGRARHPEGISGNVPAGYQGLNKIPFERYLIVHSWRFAFGFEAQDDI